MPMKVHGGIGMAPWHCPAKRDYKHHHRESCQGAGAIRASVCLEENQAVQSVPDFRKPSLDT